MNKFFGEQKEEEDVVNRISHSQWKKWRAWNVLEQFHIYNCSGKAYFSL